MEDHWRKCHQVHPHALTILAKLFRNMDEVNNYFRNIFRQKARERIIPCFYSQNSSVCL